MSKQFQVQVEFRPSGEDDLITALRNLATAQNNLSQSSKKMALDNEKLRQAQAKTAIAYNKLTAAQDKNKLSIEKLKQQNQILKDRVQKSSLALQKYKASLGSATRTGVAATRSNRLLSNSFATMRSTILLASFGISLISGSFIKLAALAGEQKRVEDQLATALGRTSQALLDQASALQQTTGFGDESIIAAQAQLAAFTDNEEQIQGLTKATLDFASAQGMSLNEAAKLVGKSIGSSTNAMSRYGITVEGAVGSTQRFDSAIAGISQLFEGQANARLLSFNGQLELAAGNIGDVGEDLGAQLVPALTKALQNFNAFALIIQENKKAFHALSSGLKLGMVILTMYFIRLNSVKKLFMLLPNAVKAVTGGQGKFRVMIKNSSAALALFAQRLGQIPIGFRKFSKIGKDMTKQIGLLGSRLEFTGLASLVASLGVGALASHITGLLDSIKGMLGLTDKDTESKDKNTDSINKNNLETAKFIELREKANDVMEKAAQKSFILASGTAVEETQRKALTKTLNDFNKQSGLDIELKDIGNIQDLQAAINSQTKVKLTEEEIAKAQELAQEIMNLNLIQETGSISNAQATDLRRQSMVSLAGSFAQLNEGSKSATLVSLRLQQIEAVASAYNAMNRYLEMKPPRPGLATMALTQGLANAAMIEKQGQKARAAATGADFVTQGRQMLMVGDNESGREHVQVTPLGNNSRGSVGGSSTVTINLNGNVLGTDDFVRDTLIPEIQNTINRNLA